MVPLRWAVKIRRVILFGLIWTLVIVTLIQWQQKKLRRKEKHRRFNLSDESESSSGEDFSRISFKFLNVRL